MVRDLVSMVKSLLFLLIATPCVAIISALPLQDRRGLAVHRQGAPQLVGGRQAAVVRRGHEERNGGRVRIFFNLSIREKRPFL